MPAHQIVDDDFDVVRAWRDDWYLRRVRACTAVDWSEGECRSCPVRYWCLGGCHGETFAATGRLGARSPNCAELRRALLDDPNLRNGLNIHQGRVTCAAVAEALNLAWTDAEKSLHGQA